DRTDITGIKRTETDRADRQKWHRSNRNAWHYNHYNSEMGGTKRTDVTKSLRASVTSPRRLCRPKPFQGLRTSEGFAKCKTLRKASGAKYPADTQFPEVYCLKGPKGVHAGPERGIPCPQ